MCTTVSLAPKFRSPVWRPFRAAMFVGMGLSAVVPVLHGLKLYGIEEMRGRMGLAWVVLEGLLYVLGAALYAVSRMQCLKAGIPSHYYVLMWKVYSLTANIVIGENTGEMESW